jgi:TPR repeat protein
LGDGVSENPGRAFGYFRAGAIGGRMDAAHNLGAAYAKGRGVRRDFTEALAWLIVARARGDTSGAEQQLRDRLIERHREEMVKTAEKHAGEWQRRFSREEIAAALPLPAPFEFGPAAGELTNVEAEDGPVEKLETPATPPVVVMTILGDRLTWPTVDALQRAANRGEPAALGALGRLLAAGKLMPADPLGAVVLLEHSAALGNVDAAHQLGDLYADGEKLLRDDAKSFAYFTQAARGGSLLAMASVGVYYTNGRGVERDLVKGLAWLIVAKHYRVDLGQEGRLRSFLVQHRTDDVAKAESVAAGLIHEIDALAK